MPIPKLTGDMTKEQIIAKYAEMGWKKKLTYEWVEVDQRNGGYIKSNL